MVLKVFTLLILVMIFIVHYLHPRIQHLEILKTHHVVTKKISEVLFNEPAKLGDVLEFLCCVKVVGKTSITIECITRAKQIDMEDRLRTILNCDLVFVKIDKFGRPALHNYVPEDN